VGAEQSPDPALDPPAEGNGPEQLRVRSVDAVAGEHGVTPPDEYGGTESSRNVVDYGGPILLSDSSRDSYRMSAEREIWERLLERKRRSD
jgi:hypothetical protein